MKPNLVNIDYEYFLFDPNYSLFSSKYKKMREELEYLLFFCEPGLPLFSKKVYEESYLNFVLQITGQQPEIVNCTDHFDYWWGRPEERKYNSKLESQALAEKMGLSAEKIFQVTAFEEIKKIILPTHNNWLLKDPGQFSGQGMIVLNQENIEQKQKNIQSLLNKGMALLEPLHHRLFDVGILVKNDLVVALVENFISDHFHFKGGRLRPLRDCLSFKEINLIEKLIEELRAEGVHNFQFDCYFYQEEEQIKFRLAEINRRKTMGEVLWILSQKYPAKQSSWIKIYGKGELRDGVKNVSNYDRQSQTGYILLSPADCHLQLVYYAFADENDLKKWEQQLLGIT